MNQFKLMQAMDLLDKMSAEGVTQGEASERLQRELHLSAMQSQLVIRTWLQVNRPSGKPSNL